MLKIKWLLVLFIINFAHSLSAQKTLGLQLISDKVDTKYYYYYPEEIINIRFFEGNKIKKIKGPLVVLNNKEISVNGTVISIDKITQIKNKNHSISGGILQIIGGITISFVGLGGMALGAYNSNPTGIAVGVLITAFGTYQIINGFNKLRSKSILIDQNQHRLIAVEIIQLTSQ
jgi:hypothetical protein